MPDPTTDRQMTMPDTMGDIHGTPVQVPSQMDRLTAMFTYHPPTGNQPLRYLAIRQKALELAQLIAEYTPLCADQTAAIRKLRECVMTANAAIALEGLV